MKKETVNLVEQLKMINSFTDFVMRMNYKSTCVLQSDGITKKKSIEKNRE